MFLQVWFKLISLVTCLFWSRLVSSGQFFLGSSFLVLSPLSFLISSRLVSSVPVSCRLFLTRLIWPVFARLIPSRSVFSVFHLIFSCLICLLLSWLFLSNFVLSCLFWFLSSVLPGLVSSALFLSHVSCIVSFVLSDLVLSRLHSSHPTLFAWSRPVWSRLCVHVCLPWL